MKITYATRFRNTFPRIVLLCFALSMVSMTGCGRTKGGKISGKVTFEGKPVTAGTLVFSPVPKSEDDSHPGVPTSVTIEPDGTYSADTSVTGNIRVLYNAPGPDYPPGYKPMPSEPAPESPFVGLIPKQNELEVVAGTNTIDIDLFRPAPAPAPVP